jgi:hypothetical protein
LKRILLDENLPRLLRRSLLNSPSARFRKKAGEHSRTASCCAARKVHFDVLLTADRRMQYQQKLHAYGIGVVVIVTPRLQLAVIERASEALRQALLTVAYGGGGACESTI